MTRDQLRAAIREEYRAMPDVRRRCGCITCAERFANAVLARCDRIEVTQ